MFPIYTAAWLAQLIKCQSAEREVAGSNPGQTKILGLKITKDEGNPLCHTLFMGGVGK